MKVASCHCGQLSVQCKGRYLVHGQCSCEDCQRRTGTPTSFQIYYKFSQLSITGQHTVYSRDAIGERGIAFNFCPECGSTVFFDIPWADSVWGEKVIGIPLGCFNDPSIEAPEYSVWGCRLPEWLPASSNKDFQMAEQPSSIDEIKEVFNALGKI